MSAKKVTFILIAAAAMTAIGAGAWLYADKQAAEPVSQAEADQLVDQNLVNSELMQESLDAQIEGLQESNRERLDSPAGQALMTRCLEWQQFHADHPNETTEQNREKACSEYERFIATGELPDDDE